MNTLTRSRKRKQHTHHTEHFHIHWTVVGRIRMYCIQPDCDGEHHFYCSCHAARSHSV